MKKTLTWVLALVFTITFVAVGCVTLQQTRQTTSESVVPVYPLDPAAPAVPSLYGGAVGAAREMARRAAGEAPTQPSGVPAGAN